QLMAEELATRQFWDDSGAIKNDEVAFIRTRIQRMGKVRQQLLAGAAFAENQYRRVGKMSYLHYLTQNRLKSLRSEEHTSELQSRENLVCRLLLEKKNVRR